MSWVTAGLTVYNMISERRNMQKMIDRITGPTDRAIANIEDYKNDQTKFFGRQERIHNTDDEIFQKNLIDTLSYNVEQSLNKTVGASNMEFSNANIMHENFVDQGGTAYGREITDQNQASLQRAQNLLQMSYDSDAAINRIVGDAAKMGYVNTRYA